MAEAWFMFSGYEYHEADDHYATIEGERFHVEVKGSFTTKNPPWPATKGMGGWQREVYRRLIAEDEPVLLFQVAIGGRGSVRAAVFPLTLENLPSGKGTIDYKTNVDYF